MDTQILLGSLLQKFGYIDNDRLQEILSIQKTLKNKGEDKKIGDILKEKGLVDDKAIRQMLEQQRGLFNTKLSLKDYQVIEKIDQGGMGVIYKAFNTRMKRTVAVKVLSPRAVKNPRHVARFLAEMKTLSSLNHANLVRFLEAGQSRGLLYYTMEYVSGTRCDKLLKQRGSFDSGEVTRIVHSVCKALGYLHSNGLVHRDIKPQNIIMMDDGGVKICDLGLAIDAASESKNSEETVSVDEFIIGTPLYMSPEQIRGVGADPRSDIYSLGITTYFLMTGQPPYTGSSLEILAKHLKEPLPDPKLANKNVDDSLCELVVRMTAKDPDKRIQTIDEVLLVIERDIMKKERFSTTVRYAFSPRYLRSKMRGRKFYIYSAFAAAAVSIPILLYWLL